MALKGRYEGGILISFSLVSDPAPLDVSFTRTICRHACMLQHPLWIVSRASCLVLFSPVQGSSEIHKLTTFPMAAHSDWGAKVRIPYMECCLLSLKAYQPSRIEYIFFNFICWFVTTKWASLLAQLVKNRLKCRRPQFDSWVGKTPWRRVWQPTPVFLPGECPWTEEPGGLQFIVSQSVRHDRSDWACVHARHGLI